MLLDGPIIPVSTLDSDTVVYFEYVPQLSAGYCSDCRTVLSSLNTGTGRTCKEYRYQSNIQLSDQNSWEFCL